MKNLTKMKSFKFLLLVPFAFACSRGEQSPDAWGNFDATEIIISSETAGRILSIPVGEGDIVNKGDLAAQTDTTLLRLSIKEIEATRSGVKTRINSIEAQNSILQQQITNIGINVERVKNMIEGSAATQKQLDDLTGQIEILKKQIIANNTQKSSILSELAIIESKESIIREQLSRCYVRFPSAGTVLTRYSEPGEITAPGKPILKIADLSLMKLKVFVSGAQISDIILGQTCVVRLDQGEKGFHNLTGKVSQISDKAEFTPKIIQTKEERVDLVYAIIIEVINDGSIKSGMPGEAIFNRTE
jgi:HlyD family secretion protein